MIRAVKTPMIWKLIERIFLLFSHSIVSENMDECSSRIDSIAKIAPITSDTAENERMCILDYSRTRASGHLQTRLTVRKISPSFLHRNHKKFLVQGVQFLNF